MSKLNIPKTILTSTILIAFTLIAGFFVYGYLEIKKMRDLSVNFVEFVEPVENNNQEPVEPVEMEIYEAELFIEAKWGDGEGEAGIFMSGGDEGGAGPVYGPQSFDVDDRTGYLYLLDSVNERVLEYDESGKYLKTFPIACGGTGDVRVSPDGEFLCVFSWRCEAIYKYDISGEFLESYKILPNEKERPNFCRESLEFDENKNVMLKLEIEDFEKGCRFYQIGKDGDEWKNNNYENHISKDGKEYYKLRQINSHNRSVEIISKEGELLKKISVELSQELLIKLSQKVYVYYLGCDKENIYLDVAFEHGSMDEGFYFDDVIWKYSKEKGLLAKIDILEPFKKMYNITDNKFLPNYSYTWAPIVNERVVVKEDIYRMFTFKNEGLKIFKYSKIE